MSVINVGDKVRCVGSCPPYFAKGDVGVVVQISHESRVWYKINFSGFGNKVVHGDGLWEAQAYELVLVPKTAVVVPAQGHSGVHEGLQNHSVGATYPLAVVTYGHDPAIHVIENLKTGEVACDTSGVVIQTTNARFIFEELRWLIDHPNRQINWVKGRPKNAGGSLVLVKPLEQKDKKHELFLALTNEALRIGRDLTPFEAYQVACDFDNR